MSAEKAELTIGVLGLGHVGLPTALGMAELGWQVVGADDDPAKAQFIAQGSSPFYEPGLGELLKRHLDSGRFKVAPDVSAAIQQATVLFICVGTPQHPDGAADLSQIEAVSRTIAANLNGYKLVVEKSTSPVQTAAQIRRAIQQYRAGARNGHGAGGEDAGFDIAVNPEFLREGTALADFFAPDRIVVGAETPRARALMTQVYQPLLDRIGPSAGGPGTDHSRLIMTSLNTAEIIKHASNAFLSTKISFINMVADLCDATGADVTEVQRGLSSDHRIGRQFLQAGIGFGGYCLPKDLRALVHIGEENGVDMSLLRGVEAINETRVDRLLNTLKEALWVLDGKTLAIWGLAFKPETDDVREAPSLRVVERLLKERNNLRLFDPEAMKQFQTQYPAKAPRLVYCDSAEDAAKGADAIVLLTEWPAFRNVDLKRLRSSMNYPLILDGRNHLDAGAARALGFEYIGVGRRPLGERHAESSTSQ